MREENFFYKGRWCFIVQTQPLNANYVKETLYGLTEEKMSLWESEEGDERQMSMQSTVYWVQYYTEYRVQIE